MKKLTKGILAGLAGLTALGLGVSAMTKKSDEVELNPDTENEDYETVEDEEETDE